MATQIPWKYSTSRLVTVRLQFKKNLFDRKHHYYFSHTCLSTQAGGTNKNNSVVDYFELLGIKRSFDVSQEEIKSTYKNLMTKYHPDRHMLKSKHDQEVASGEATKITHGYSILQDDHKRALHLLELNDNPLKENISGDIVGQEFLIEIMELREEVENAVDSEKELNQLLLNNKRRMDDTCKQLGIAFCENNLEEAKRLTAMLQYWKRIDELILDKL